jgi:hypothetical protein
LDQICPGAGSKCCKKKTKKTWWYLAESVLW